MIELPLLSLDLVRSMVQNFTIIATLVLLYHFIPDSLRSRSKPVFSLCVGAIFGMAAAISIPALWQTTGGTVIGFNIILVPLSGFIGGPVSSVFVATVLLLGSTASTGTPSSTDILTVMSGILLGALFYSGQSWIRLPRSHLVQLFLLGTGVALIELCAVLLTSALQVASDLPAGSSRIIDILPFLLVSCVGTVILGSIIGFIDRKKQAERELLDYKDHLEGLVKERTLELRQANSLQKATIESTADAIVVVDREGIIRAYNQKASHILDLPRTLPGKSGGSGTFTGAATDRLLDPEGFLRLVTPLPESAEEVIATNLEFKNGRIYEIFVQPQHIGDHILGRVWSFHDITDQRRAEDAMKIANSKLVLLADITRHDILNQITALSGYLELAQEKIRDPVVSGYLDTMKKTLEVIRLQLEFTRDYQDLGLHKPGWQGAGAAFTRAAESFEGKGIVFHCETGNVEVFADPMIGQVFHNLMDNSLRHGEQVSGIRLSIRRVDRDLLVVYEDDGIGIPPEEKEKIFLKGFGKHTGLGMFLIREILSITGLTIRETGTYRQGVRFGIHVPSGKFRFP